LVIAPIAAVPATGVTDNGLDDLTGFGSLTRLHLDSRGISNVAGKHLSKLTQLRHLDLFGSRLSDKGCQHLRCKTSLPLIFQSGCAVSLMHAFSRTPAPDLTTLKRFDNIIDFKMIALSLIVALDRIPVTSPTPTRENRSPILISIIANHALFSQSYECCSLHKALTSKSKPQHLTSMEDTRSNL
jgi:hypothetical protein